MKKYTQFYLLFLLLVLCTISHAQDKADLAANNGEKVIAPIVPNNITRTLKQDSNGNIWIAAFDGVFRYDGNSFTNITSEVSSARFFSVLEDRKGNFWLSSVGSGVYYYDGESFRNFTTKDGLASDVVGAIYEDKTGNIWFGTEGGVSRYDGKTFRNFTTKDGLPHNAVATIMEDKTGQFWIGTKAGICLYDGKSFTIFRNEDNMPFYNVRAIIEDKKGKIWLGGEEGLWRYEGRASGSFGNALTKLSNNFVASVYEDKKGNIWTSSQETIDRKWLLSRYDEKSLAAIKPNVTEIPSEREGNKGMLFGILEVDEGSIWLGALDGVYRYDGKTITDFKGKNTEK